MSDYNNANNGEVITDRSAKNRFLGFLWHANQVNDYWGYNWSFSCGVVVFSIAIGIMTLFDINAFFTGLFNDTDTWLLFWLIVRFISDFITLIGIILAIISIIQSNFTHATIGYYCIVLSLLLNFAFCVYCIISIFDKKFWEKTTYRIVVWLFNEVCLFVFCWILFCNMVDVGRQNKRAAQTTY